MLRHLILRFLQCWQLFLSALSELLAVGGVLLLLLLLLVVVGVGMLDGREDDGPAEEGCWVYEGYAMLESILQLLHCVLCPSASFPGCPALAASTREREGDRARLQGGAMSDCCWLEDYCCCLLLVLVSRLAVMMQGKKTVDVDCCLLMKQYYTLLWQNEVPLIGHYKKALVFRLISCNGH